ncbi:MAG TPA: sensor domain-containing diguanylate cyclase, partial [Acidimicrobiales bacterium]|nr:sensor domain-containing diguanylate cyclase [Acidimicrobiales bacterium]
MASSRALDAAPGPVSGSVPKRRGCLPSLGGYRRRQGAGRAESARLASTEHISLEQRLGTLQWVRVATVVLALATAASAPKELGITVARALPLSIAYLACCLAGQGVDYMRERWTPARPRPGGSGAPLQQMLLPVDSVYLAMLTVPSGGAQSDLIWLFAVQLIAVTLLAGRRTGLRVAMWDSALLLAISMLKLNGPLGELLGAPQVYVPSVQAIMVRISGFWAVTLCTAYFSVLSERELRRSKAQLDALTKMASEMEETIEAGGNVGQITTVLLASVLGPFGFTRAAAVWERKTVVTAARAYLVPGAATRVEEVQLTSSPLDSPLARRSVAQNNPLLVRQLPSYDEPVLSSLMPSAENVVVVPLRAGRDSLGLLLAESGPPAGRRVSRRTLDMVCRFGAHAALAFSNAELKREVSTLAASDALTGLANRRALSGALAREIARTARTKRPLSVAVVDIDFFKRINDTHGHLKGDEVLRDVARAMASTVRDVDIVARYGGEEFAIVLPDCASDGAMAVVERVRAAVAALATVEKVTLSAGVASVIGEGNDGELLMAAADEALYISKNSGRDRATMARDWVVIAAQAAPAPPPQ